MINNSFGCGVIVVIVIICDLSVKLNKGMAWFSSKQKHYVKVYHGYGHTGSLVVSGHVFKRMPYTPVAENKGLVPNFIRLLQLFL